MARVTNYDELHKGYLDLEKNELRNAQIQNLASDPSSPDEGQIWYRTDTDRLMVQANGSAEELATVDDITAGGISVSIIDAKGDLLAGTGNDAIDNLTVGANGTLLVANSAQATGLEWRTITEADIQLGATDRLVGRDTAGAGAAEEITVSGGLEWTGSGGIQSSAYTGDVTKSAGGTALTIPNDTVTYAKMQNVSATDRLLGRDTAGAGDTEELTVGGGVEFTGSGGIQRSALTGDITASAGSNTTAIAAGVIVDADVNASAAIAATKLAFTPAQGIAATTVQAAIEEAVTDLNTAITAATEGKAWKDPVRVATTANGTLATAFENGDTVDGVTLATGDRILLKDQSSGAENGIYTVNASGAPTRASDMNVNTEANNATVLVEEGTANKGDTYTQTANIVTLGTTAMVWAKSGEGNTVYTASGGVTLTGSNFDTTVSGLSGGMAVGDLLYASGSAALAKLADVATGNALISGGVTTAPSWGKIGLTTHVSGTLPIANGGTGQTTAAAALAALGGVTKFSQDLTGGASSEVVTHNLGTRDVTVQVRNQNTPWAYEDFEVEATSTNTITIRAAASIPASTYRVVVTG